MSYKTRLLSALREKQGKESGIHAATVADCIDLIEKIPEVDASDFSPMENPLGPSEAYRITVYGKPCSAWLMPVFIANPSEVAAEMQNITEDEIPGPFTWAGMPLQGYEHIKGTGQLRKIPEDDGWISVKNRLPEEGKNPEPLTLDELREMAKEKAYADVRVTKDKADYPLSRWQLDAHAFWRSSGNRNLTPEELARLKMSDRMRRFREYSQSHVYDYDQHVALSYALEQKDAISKEFMTVPPASTSPDVWDDISRMKTLNTTQSQRRKQLHVCPLQLDIVERIIERYSNPGDWIFDPFAGLATVPMVAVRMGRKGYGCELNSGYFADGVGYLRAEEAEVEQPSLFDMFKEDVV